MKPDWTTRDSALVMAASLLPILSAVGALAAPDEMLGVSPVLIVWTFWALAGVLLAAYKTWLLSGDQLALRTLRKSFRAWLGGLWSLSNAVSLFTVCALWLAVGVMALLRIPWANVITALLMMPHGVVLGTLVFGIIVRRKLAE